jgi:uncharacterized protein
MNPIIQEKLDEIRTICILYKVKDLYTFGSVTNDTFNKDSDIDLLVSFKDISLEEYSDNYFNLHYLFQDLFGRKVDLITKNSLSNPYFIKSIEQTKSLVYEG